jgi:hypothetical protein
MPDAGKIELLRMKVTDAIGLRITTAVMEGKNYKGICEILTQRYQRDQSAVWQELESLSMYEFRDRTLGFESKLRELFNELRTTIGDDSLGN